MCSVQAIDWPLGWLLPWKCCQKQSGAWAIRGTNEQQGGLAGIFPACQTTSICLFNFILIYEWPFQLASVILGISNL